MSFYKPIACTGHYYNFKKGFEECPNKCHLYNENAHHLTANCNYSPVWFRNIKEFRTCKNADHGTNRQKQN